MTQARQNNKNYSKTGVLLQPNFVAVVRHTLCLLIYYVRFTTATTAKYYKTINKVIRGTINDIAYIRCRKYSP